MADYCDGGSNVPIVGGGGVYIFEAVLGNSEEIRNDEGIKKTVGEQNYYTSVIDSEARIGDVIMYKLDENAEKILIIEGMSPDVAKETVQKEIHYSTVVLKDKTGSAPSQIVQKNGRSHFDFKVDAASDNRLPQSQANYTTATPTGAQTPINRRIEE